MNIVALVVIVYLVVTILIGGISRKKVIGKTFFGNNLGLLMCIAIGAGEWMGGTSTTGVSEYGYLYGMSGAWYTIANGIGIFILGIMFVTVMRKANAVTVPGIIDSYIGKRAKLVSSIMILISLILVGTSQMLALGTLGEALLGLPKIVAILLIGLVVVIYTSVGGMEMVGRTNIIHTIILYIGMIVACLIKLNQIGGIEGLHRNLPTSFFSMGTIGFPKVSSWIIASVLGACTAQAGLQPILCADSEKTARRASLAIAFIVAPFGLFTAFLGMISKTFYPDIQNAKAALPMLLMDLHPVLSVIVIVAVFSAIFSTAAPIILSCGTIVEKDILPFFDILPPKVDAVYLKMNRMITASSGIVCVLFSVCFLYNSRILDIVYFAYAIRGSIFIILLLGIYWKKYTEMSAVAAMIMTSMLSIIWIIYKHHYGEYPIWPALSEVYISIISAIIFSLIFNLFFARKQNEKRC